MRKLSSLWTQSSMFRLSIVTTIRFFEICTNSTKKSSALPHAENVPFSASVIFLSMDSLRTRSSPYVKKCCVRFLCSFFLLFHIFHQRRQQQLRTRNQEANLNCLFRTKPPSPPNLCEKPTLRTLPCAAEICVALLALFLGAFWKTPNTPARRGRVCGIARDLFLLLRVHQLNCTFNAPWNATTVVSTR